MVALDLREAKHPDPAAQSVFDSLIGIDEQKGELLETLLLMLDPKRLDSWQRKHHPKGLNALSVLRLSDPLVILSGDVGCGKTALADSIGTPLAEKLDARVTCYQTPSDIRGKGMVGELSARITSCFDQVRSRLPSGGHGILIIDEGDDVATSRTQMHAHHEDRAGLNVLVKQLDLVSRDDLRLAVLLITNRASVLDPAVLRRAAAHIHFARPDSDARAKLFRHILAESKPTAAEIDALCTASERSGLPFTYSDIARRATQSALRKALQRDRKFSSTVLLEALESMAPTPLL